MAATLSSLPPELLIEVFRRLPPNAALAVCREFRQLYHDNSRSVTLVRGGGGPSLTAAVQRCPTLWWLTVPPGVGASSTGALTRLQCLEVPLWWALDQIPPTLVHLSVGGGRWLVALAASSGAVVAQVDGAASTCVVHLRALCCGLDTADVPWLSSPHVRLAQAAVFSPSLLSPLLLMRVLQAAPVLRLASLAAWSVSASAVSVLQSLSMS